MNIGLLGVQQRGIMAKFGDLVLLNTKASEDLKYYTSGFFLILHDILGAFLIL